MLTLKGKSGCVGSWHVGEVMRIPEGQVIILSADGDELWALIEALRAADIKVVYPSDKLTPVY